MFASTGAHESRNTSSVEHNQLLATALRKACRGPYQFTLRTAPAAAIDDEFFERWNQDTRVRFDEHNMYRCPTEAKSIHLLDLAVAVEQRAHGMQRIQGDSEYHYGTPARIAMVQILLNYLSTKDRFDARVGYRVRSESRVNK